MTTVTVFSGPERRRRWTSDEKLRIVEESLSSGTSIADVARRHDVHPNLLHQWRRQARTGVFGAASESGPAPGGGVGFAAVAVAPERPGLSGPAQLGSGTIEIEFATGARIRVTGGIDAAMVAAAIAAVARREQRR